MSTRPGACVAVALLTAALVALSDSGASRAADPPPPATAPPAGDVTITSKYDQRTLVSAIVPHFVASHGAPTAAIEQIARWYGPICPSVTGLVPRVNDLITQRIQTVAQSIGARTPAPGQKCKVDIEVLFTSSPQALLDDIVHHHPEVLGSGRRSGDTRFSRAVQSWYTTGTRQKIPPEPAMPGLIGSNPSHDPGQSAEELQHLTQGTTPTEYPATSDSPDLVPDAPYSGPAPTGLAGSYLTSELRSELLHVLIIVDAQKLVSAPLQPLADYIAMLSLTRITSLDTCNELPSILDLLSDRCTGRARPAGITPADRAYLKALYASELDKKLNVEEGEVRDRMMANLLTP